MLVLLAVHLLALAFVYTCSVGGATSGGIPVLAYCALLIFAMQWLAFIPAYRHQTEKYYDLVGSITFIGAVLLAVLLTGSLDGRRLLLATLVAVWALRLGLFLFQRIRREGHDTRFDNIKPNPWLFLRTWVLQALWVLVTAGSALTAITSTTRPPLGLLAAAGFGLWLVGFGIEVVADHQKRQFRALYGGSAFIDTGLWSRSRHPNYFGEIILWCGVALIALPALQGWQHLALISPVFVYLLLTRVSGIPMLERASDRRWGDDPRYLAYKKRTPVLIPRLVAAKGLN